jgi:hypothetical protein
LDHTNGFDTPSAAQEALTDPPIPADSTPWENNTPPESPDAPSPDPKPSAHLKTKLIHE